jgi:hypothetical protein
MVKKIAITVECPECAGKRPSPFQSLASLIRKVCRHKDS